MKGRSKGFIVPVAAILFAAVLFLFREQLSAAWFSPGGIFLCALPAADVGKSTQQQTPAPQINISVLEADEDVGEGVLIELLNVEGGSDYQFSGEEPTVLIYHTHTTEAYLPTEEAPYECTTEWRTNDQSNNVVRVGEELARLLRERGFNVIHDTTDHEPPKLGTSYERSLETMKRYQE